LKNTNGPKHAAKIAYKIAQNVAASEFTSIIISLYIYQKKYTEKGDYATNKNSCDITVTSPTKRFSRSTTA